MSLMDKVKKMVNPVVHAGAKQMLKVRLRVCLFDIIVIQRPFVAAEARAFRSWARKEWYAEVPMAKRDLLGVPPLLLPSPTTLAAARRRWSFDSTVLCYYTTVHNIVSALEFRE
mmetsp:Transcript_1116/g.2499  ORF Transcript_1116/g.2499 Transcript_1116/m.2499 type:complete len:114 (-) Transcript_1116:1035-1376(-)